MNNRSTRKFCDYLDAEVRTAPPRRKIVCEPDESLFKIFEQGEDDISKYAFPTQKTVSVEMVDVTMPKEMFEVLVGRFDYMEDVLASGAAINLHPADRVWEQYLQEARARANNPGIMKAYERYLMFLELAGVKRLG